MGLAPCTDKSTYAVRHSYGVSPRSGDDEHTLARCGSARVRRLAARVVAMIRIDAVWLSTVPRDMRTGTDTALARVAGVFGAAHQHTAYLFANRCANRMKVLVHDGIGIWLAARRLHQGYFVWPQTSSASAPGGVNRVSLSRAQLDALVLGLPWSRIGEGGIITVV